MKARILIVDDSLVARRMLVRQLKELGYGNIVEADNGIIAVDKLVESRESNQPFSLIITDLRMPEMSGTEFINKIKEESDFSKIPKLIVSVETDRGAVLEAVLTGAEDYILKPTSTAVLQEKLNKVFASKKVA